MDRSKSQLLPAHLPEDVRDEAELNAEKIEAEYEVARRARAARHNPSRRRGAQIMRQMHKEGMREHAIDGDYVNKSQKMREHILSMSLFPNIYNKKMVMTHS